MVNVLSLKLRVNGVPLAKIGVTAPLPVTECTILVMSLNLIVVAQVEAPPEQFTPNTVPEVAALNVIALPLALPI